MIRVRIGPTENKICDVSESWINEQVNRRKNDNVPVCVEVIIKTSNINIALSTAECGGSGGGRQPNIHERKILDLWEKMQLNKENFTGGNIIAFLRQVESYI